MEHEEALDDIRYIKSLLFQMRGNLARAAWFLVIWGVVWLLGFLTPALGVPGRWEGQLWLGLVAAGWLVSLAVMYRQFRRAPRPWPLLARLWLWSGLAIAGTGAAVLVLVYTMGSPVVLADPWFRGYFSAVCIGAWYALGGVIFGRPMALAGAWLVVLGLGIPMAGLGPVLGPAVMGVGGGGALIATGLIARRGAGRA